MSAAAYTPDEPPETNRQLSIEQRARSVPYKRPFTVAILTTVVFYLGLLALLTGVITFLLVPEELKREVAYSIDGSWHNIAYTKQTLEYVRARADIEVIALELLSVNDPIFGFAQRNSTLRYRLASSVAALLKMESGILLTGRLNP